MTKLSPPYVLRKVEETDLGFVYSNWSRVFREVPPMNMCPAAIFKPQQKKVIDCLLNTAKLLVACHPDDSDELLGFICYEFVAEVLVVHWIHIKSIFQHQHIASDILKTLYPEMSSIIFTHNFREASKLRSKFNLVYDPFFIINRIKEQE
jgi:hypothetical protein